MVRASLQGAAAALEVEDRLRQLPLYLDTHTHFFVHAGVDPARSIHDQRRETMLWQRGDLLQGRDFHGRDVVHGHTPVREPTWTGRSLNVDTGAFKTGILTAAVLGEEPVRFLSVDARELPAVAPVDPEARLAGLLPPLALSLEDVAAQQVPPPVVGRPAGPRRGSGLAVEVG